MVTQRKGLYGPNFVIPFTFIKQPTCISCRRHRLSYEEPSKSEEQKIRELMPSATEAMITLIMSQIKNSNNKNANQNRWDSKIANECLKWYTRSPLSYIQMRQSGLLIRPSPSMLILYKPPPPHLNRTAPHLDFQDKNRMLKI